MSYQNRKNTLSAIILAARVSEDAAICLAIEAGLVDANDYEGGSNGTFEDAMADLAEDYEEFQTEDDEEDDES
jgi:hypothetical protein